MLARDDKVIVWWPFVILRVATSVTALCVLIVAVHSDRILKYFDVRSRV